MADLHMPDARAVMHGAGACDADDAPPPGYRPALQRLLAQIKAVRQDAASSDPATQGPPGDCMADALHVLRALAMAPAAAGRLSDGVAEDAICAGDATGAA